MLKCLFIRIRAVGDDFFSINNGCAYKRHVMVVSLAILVNFTACAAIKAEPCSVETSFFIPWQENSELGHSLLKSCKSFFEEKTDALRPIYRDWVNILKFRGECIYEFFGCFAECTNPLDMKSPEDSKKCSKYWYWPYRKIFKIVHAFLLGFIIAIPPLLVEVRRYKKELEGQRPK